MDYFPWISFAISLAVLLIQALARYGVAKQEESLNKRFAELEKDVVDVQATQKGVDQQLTSVLVTMESIKTKQDGELATRQRHDTLLSEMKGEMVSKELFEARMNAFEQNINNLGKAQTDVLAKFVEWLHKQEANKPIPR